MSKAASTGPLDVAPCPKLSPSSATCVGRFRGVDVQKKGPWVVCGGMSGEVTRILLLLSLLLAAKIQNGRNVRQTADAIDAHSHCMLS